MLKCGLCGFETKALVMRGQTFYACLTCAESVDRVAENAVRDVMRDCHCGKCEDGVLAELAMRGAEIGAGAAVMA